MSQDAGFNKNDKKPDTIKYFVGAIDLTGLGAVIITLIDRVLLIT